MNFENIKIENGWIICVIFLAVTYLPSVFNKKGYKRLVNFSWLSKQGYAISIVLFILYFGMLAYIIFLPIQSENLTFFTGLIVFVMGLFASVISFINYFSTALDEVICKGIYRISRNPVYVSSAICWIGMALLFQSVIIFVTTALYMILSHWIVLEEENFCQEKYGQSYLDYKKRVPRYLLF